jgi:hypothetical protein
MLFLAARSGVVASLLAAAAVGTLEVLVASPPVLGGRARAAAGYDLHASYPNMRRARGYFLRGVNPYGSATSTGLQRTSLWFRPAGRGAFKQFNTTPYRTCHSDLLRWQPGKHGLLVYLETEAYCYSDHTRLVFQPGIAYMPKAWAPGEEWSTDGVSNTVYFENGVAVCAGLNKWRSRVVGLARLPNGVTAVHTQTDETQTLAAIEGAPSSVSCPTGQASSFAWQENFYLGGVLTIRRQDGSAIGSDVGLLRSTGGNLAAARQVGHWQWESTFENWDAFPPADAGTVTTIPTQVANSSAGNTITFTYTAPGSGLENGLLTIAVPSGWTPPAVDDTAGCTTATAGTLTTDGQTISVTALTLPPYAQLVISYGATSGGRCTSGDGATAAPTPGAPVWQLQATLREGGPFTNLPSSPSISVEPT